MKMAVCVMCGRYCLRNMQRYAAGIGGGAAAGTVIALPHWLRTGAAGDGWVSVTGTPCGCAGRRRGWCGSLHDPPRAAAPPQFVV